MPGIIETIEVLDGQVSPPNTQPIPIETMVGRAPVGVGLVVTSITRHWSPGDEKRCRLCDRCSASVATHSCNVLTTDPVPPGGAALYSLRGRPVFRPDGQLDLGLRVHGA